MDQGSYFAFSVSAVDENNSLLALTAGSVGYTPSAYAKTSYISTTYIPIACSFTGPAGNILCEIGTTFSAAMKPVRYVYDVNLQQPSAKTVRQQQGTLNVDPLATK